MKTNGRAHGAKSMEEASFVDPRFASIPSWPTGWRMEHRDFGPSPAIWFPSSSGEWNQVTVGSALVHLDRCSVLRLAHGERAFIPAFILTRGATYRSKGTLSCIGGDKRASVDGWSKALNPGLSCPPAGGRLQHAVDIYSPFPRHIPRRQGTNGFTQELHMSWLNLV